MVHFPSNGSRMRIFSRNNCNTGGEKPYLIHPPALANTDYFNKNKLHVWTGKRDEMESFATREVTDFSHKSGSAGIHFKAPLIQENCLHIYYSLSAIPEMPSILIALFTSLFWSKYCVQQAFSIPLSFTHSAHVKGKTSCFTTRKLLLI